MSCNCGNSVSRKEKAPQVVKPAVKGIKRVPSIKRVIIRPAR